MSNSKATSTSWAPGTSGNKAGRPPGRRSAFRETCRTEAERIRLAYQWAAAVEAKDDNWVKCSELLANYGFGKPAQWDAIDDEAEEKETLRLTLEEAKALANMQLPESH